MLVVYTADEALLLLGILGLVIFVWMGFRKRVLYGSYRIKESLVLSRKMSQWKVKDALEHAFKDASWTWSSFGLMLMVYSVFFILTGNHLMYGVLALALPLWSNAFIVRLWFRIYMIFTRTFHNNDPIIWAKNAVYTLIFVFGLHYTIALSAYYGVRWLNQAFEIKAWTETVLPFQTAQYMSVIVKSILSFHIQSVQLGFVLIAMLTIYDISVHYLRLRK